MLEKRNPKLDLAALGLLALTIFLAIALFTYDPADAPSDLVYPPQGQVTNACGHVGAIVAAMVFQAIGVGGYYLVLSLAVLDAALLSRRPLGEPWMRGVGWLISLLGLTALAAMAVPQLSPGPVIGAGGYLGATARGWLEMHVATAGAYILAISLVVSGWLLSTDYLLLQASSWLVA
ncbi:MAG TPA: DNA translocase FtsK 4TM domain-containing protein, partial [Pirellulales bacterium]|nr:DNA translocase FtsK 4TM domain-containing protein [Pirellulales bacterium]